MACTLSTETRYQFEPMPGDGLERRMPHAMIVLHGTENLPPEARGAALAIGNFDGVHRGHRALLQAAKDAAAKTGTKAGVILFEPHPREVFQPDKPHFRLTPLPRKLALLEAAGL